MNAAALPRCERVTHGQTCRYALMRDGQCPIHDGKQASDRLPMLAPLPLSKTHPEVQRIQKRRMPRSA